MESKVQSGAVLAVSPLLSSQSRDPYCVFHVSPPPREIGQVPFIVGFKSRRFHRGEVRSNWTHEAESGPHHAARKLGPHSGPYISPRGVSH
jgi:hypothetical protein